MFEEDKKYIWNLAIRCVVCTADTLKLLIKYSIRRFKSKLCVWVLLFWLLWMIEECPISCNHLNSHDSQKMSRRFLIFMEKLKYLQSSNYEAQKLNFAFHLPWHKFHILFGSISVGHPVPLFLKGHRYDNRRSIQNNDNSLFDILELNGFNQMGLYFISNSNLT